MISVVIHLVAQSIVLGAETMGVLGLLAVLGAGPVWLVFPSFAKLRWPIFAPLAGLAIVTIIGVPLALIGGAVAYVAPVIFAGGILGSLIVTLRMSKNQRGRRILLTWVRRRFLAGAGVLIVVAVASTALITQGGRGSVRDVWGSGDFGAYWIVSDYMQQHGANLDAYQNQTAFHAVDIQAHLSKHARLGCMVFLAYMGSILSPLAIHQVIVPSIVALILLMLGLAQCWLDSEIPHPQYVLVILLLHPFLYFLLYFTYVSQASGVVLGMAGLLIGGRKKAGKIEAILSGCLIGTAILHYPSMLLVAGVFWVMQFAVRFRLGQEWWAYLGPLTILVVGGIYLPNTLNELIWVARTAIPPGWDWRGLIGSFEFVGLRSVLGYEMPEARNMVVRVADYALIIALGVFLYAGFKYSRMRIVALTIAVTTALLSMVAVLKYLQHVPHASHAIVKNLSLFPIFFCLIAAVPVAHKCAHLSVMRRLIVSGFLLSVIVLGQGLALMRSERQEAWCNADLIQLTRRLLARSPEVKVKLAISNPHNRKYFREKGITAGSLLERLPTMEWEIAAPIVRDERRLAQKDSMMQSNCFAILSAREMLPPVDASLIADHEGEYYALPTTLLVRQDLRNERL
ncbi:MAG: hypothetical protein WCI03_01170 [bacterium]